MLVLGSGPIGALTVLAAWAAGAGEVYLSEPNAKRAAWAGSALDTSGVSTPRRPTS